MQGHNYTVETLRGRSYTGHSYAGYTYTGKLLLKDPRRPALFSEGYPPDGPAEGNFPAITI